MTTINTNDQYLAAQQERANNRITGANRWIWVRFQKEGIHCYPAAATEPELAEAAFLASPHRHIFHFEVKIQVWHSDREIEFILFKRWCESLYGSGSLEGTLDLNSRSCEMIADDLYRQISLKYPGRDVIINVSEDLENGCTIEYAR